MPVLLCARRILAPASGDAVRVVDAVLDVVAAAFAVVTNLKVSRVPLMKGSALILLLLHAIGLPVQATKHRGVWFWREAGSPWESDAIVGARQPRFPLKSNFFPSSRTDVLTGA